MPVTTVADLVAGVDGGGSKTLAVVVDGEGRERGRAVAGSSNFTVAGADQAADQIRQAVIEATRIAGGAPPLRAAWIGLSGIDRPGAREQLRERIDSLARDIRLTNDAELIFGALERNIGIVLIAGTGSIALGRDADGNVVRAGGWGHIMGDEGSGYDLGRRALRAAARAADGRGSATALLDRIMQYWNVDSPLEMIPHAYRTTEKAAIAELSSLVFAAAETGDEVAREIISCAATELAVTATAAGERLTLPDDGLPLALSGGLLTGNTGYRDLVLGRIRERRRIGQVSVVDDPALSAARSLAGAG